MTVVGWNPEGTYHPDDEWQHGIDFRGVAGGLAENVTATETLGDGLYTGHAMRYGDFTAPSTDITTRGSTFTKIGRMGIGVVNVDRAILEDSHFDAIALSAVDVEPDTDESTARSITVRNNTFGAVAHAIFTDGGKGGGLLRGNITVEGNRQTAIAPTCIPALIVTAPVGMERSGYTIRNNTVNTRSIAVRLIRVKDAIVDSNTAEWRQAGCGRSEAVDLIGSHGVDISHNALYGFTDLVRSVDSTYTESGNTLAPLPA